MKRVGIVLGRLTPGVGFPRETWAEEFTLAARAGFDCLEWLDDATGAEVNPLNTPAGRARIRELAASSGLAVPSVCAEWFTANPFVRASAADQASRLARLRELMVRCVGAGIGRIVLPCVEQAGITTTYDEMLMAELLRAVLADSRKHGVEIHLESDLDPARLASFLERVGDEALKITYDIGVSAAHGYRPADEFAAYGGRIGSVHVSDCVAFGTPVPLGEGLADLRAVFDGLAGLGFTGDLIVQTEPPAPGSTGQTLEWAGKNLAIVNRYRAVRA